MCHTMCLGFSSMWTENFQMYKLSFEEEEKQMINCQHSLDYRDRQFQENVYFCFIDYAKVFDCVDHNKL